MRAYIAYKAADRHCTPLNIILITQLTYMLAGNRRAFTLSPPSGGLRGCAHSLRGGGARERVLLPRPAMPTPHFEQLFLEG